MNANFYLVFSLVLASAATRLSPASRVLREGSQADDNDAADDNDDDEPVMM